MEFSAKAQKILSNFPLFSTTFRKKYQRSKLLRYNSYKFSANFQIFFQTSKNNSQRVKKTSSKGQFSFRVVPEKISNKSFVKFTKRLMFSLPKVENSFVPCSKKFCKNPSISTDSPMTFSESPDFFSLIPNSFRRKFDFLSNESKKIRQKCRFLFETNPII